MSVQLASDRIETIPETSQKPSQKGQTLAELKRQIAMHQYEVDPRQVADAILGKLWLLRSGRLALSGEQAGRSRPAGEPSRADR